MRLRHPALILVVASAFAAAALWQLAREDSFTVDERPHLAAGYAALHHGTLRLNPEHPPLVKLLAALPVRDIDLPREFFVKPISPQDLQYEAGQQILAGDYGLSRRIVRRSRMGPIALTLALVWCVYGLGRRLFGPMAALLGALFLLVSPLVMAHGHYVTTDVGAALGCVAATWAFLVLLDKPGCWRALLVASVVFGLAQLMKFSALLLIPFFALLAWRRGMWRSLAVVPLGFVLVVAPCYSWFNRNYPRELHRRDLAVALAHRTDSVAGVTLGLARYEVTRPLAQYAFGVAHSRYRVSEAAQIYFRGVNTGQGLTWYFPLVYLWKEPLPAMAFAAGALLLAQQGHPLMWFVALYGLVTLLSQLNIGMRHLLPAYPFVFLCAAAAWRRAGVRGWVVAGALLAWNAVETVRAYPYWLSYANPIGGGTAGLYRNVTDSNYDWGQDLERLRVWSLGHPGTIAFDYFGGDNAASALGGRVVGWWPERGDPRGSGARYLAISIQRLQSSLHVTPLGYRAEDRYDWLLAMRKCECGPGEVPPPDYRVGTTIFVYDLARR